jgi:enoyl-CoA hydratase
MNLETLSVTLAEGVARIELNRPDEANAMNRQMWQDTRSAFRRVDEMVEVRVAVISTHAIIRWAMA